MLIEQSDITEVPSLTLFVLIFATPIVLIFGMPVTFLTDLITNRLQEMKRRYAAFVIHLFFAVCFVVIFILLDQGRLIFTQFNRGDLYFLLPAVIYSFVGWYVDERLRKRFKQKITEI